MKMIYVVFTVVASLSTFASVVAAFPIIKSISPASVKAGKVVSIVGTGFGTGLKGGEVIVHYGNGFAYALKTESWSDHLISVTVSDLGKRLQLLLSVRTVVGVSRKKGLRLIAKLITEKSKKYVHQLKVGEKGEDLFRLRNSKASCGEAEGMFVEANIKITKRRFAEAQIIPVPGKSCLKCKAVKVRWFNEPTGYIEYYIETKKRLIEGVCSNRIRK